MSSKKSEKAQDILLDILLEKKKIMSVYFLTTEREQPRQPTNEMEGITCALWTCTPTTTRRMSHASICNQYTRAKSYIEGRKITSLSCIGTHPRQVCMHTQVRLDIFFFHGTTSILSLISQICGKGTHSNCTLEVEYLDLHLCSKPWRGENPKNSLFHSNT